MELVTGSETGRFLGHNPSPEDRPHVFPAETCWCQPDVADDCAAASLVTGSETGRPEERKRGRRQ